MTGVKISDLPAIAAPALTDVLPTVQSGTTYKVTNLQLATLFGFSGGILPLANGGTNAALTASNGGIFYSNASTGAILSGTATAGLLLQSGASSAPSWLATVNSAGLLTNGSGVPGWVAYTGTGAPVLATSPTLITPNIGSATFTSLQANSNGAPIIDSAGYDALLILTSGGTSVNYATLATATTGNPPSIAAAGTDTNIILQLKGKGTGGVAIQGTTAGGNAPSGYVGEFISSQVTSASPTVFTSTVVQDLTSISLTAGDWDVWGNILFSGSTVTTFHAWISATSATTPDNSLTTFIAGLATSTSQGAPVPFRRFSLSSTTTIYISGAVSGTGTLNGSGTINARRAC